MTGKSKNQISRRLSDENSNRWYQIEGKRLKFVLGHLKTPTSEKKHTFSDIFPNKNPDFFGKNPDFFFRLFFHWGGVKKTNSLGFHYGQPKGRELRCGGGKYSLKVHSES